MALGEDGDFRMVGFRQIMRFPPQDILGGTGSVLSRDYTTPFGGNIQQPGSWSTNNYYYNNNFNQVVNNLTNNNNITNNYNNYNDCDACGGGGGGGSNVNVVGDDGTGTIVTYPGISTLEFTGTNLTSVTESPTGTAIVNYSAGGGGGGGGSTIVYGQITAATKTSGIAHWTYDVTPYVSGTAQASVQAYNLLEENNTTTVAYGYSVTTASGGINVSGTSFNVYPVPNGTWVAMEDTDFRASGVNKYWFSAPNYLNGTC
jgi:hypothetical protein